jgi:histidinol-phosphate/aromatic aminotransferase/cobyric acid decarboxylase-like protein/choline kinase
MRAVILAAGFGRRMMPLTANKHKCLLEIAGRPVLNRILVPLIKNGITDITIVTGYRAPELHDFMNEYYPHLNVQWIHNEKYETTNNIYSLSLALENIANEDIVLIECDLVFDPVVISTLLNSPYEATALLSRYEPGMDGTVVSLSGDVITAIHPPHLQGYDFSFSDKYKTMNMYKFSAKFVDESLARLTSFYAKTINDNCYYELVMGVMIYMQSSEIHGVVVDTKLWSEIDDPVDVQVTEFKFNPSQRLSTLANTHGAYWNYSIEDFCYVQNAYFPSEGMNSMLRHHLPLLMKSYGSSQDNIDLKMSYFLECNKEKIVTLNGSSQVFPFLKEYLRGKSILIPEPTFGEYTRTFSDAAIYDDKVGINKKQLELLSEDNDVIVFVNPNNPTGSLVETSYIIEQVQRHKDKFFIVDESFIDFSEELSVIPWLENNADCKNLFVIKSLGKSLGVPGLRLGFIYSNDNLLTTQIRNSLPIWNINSIAEYFLELLLKNRRNLEQSFTLVKRARQRMEEELRSLPLIAEVFPSQANFVLTRLNPEFCPRQGLDNALLESSGIYVKDVSSKFKSDSLYFRFAVRRMESNDTLIRALKELSRRVPISPNARKG